MTVYAASRRRAALERAGIPTRFNRSTGASEPDLEACRTLGRSAEIAYSDCDGYHGWTWSADGRRRVRVFVPTR